MPVDYILVPLTHEKYATVDIADLPLVANHTWHSMWNGWNWYAVRWRTADDPPGAKNIYMHQVICPSPTGVDHRDRNGLNNRRSNLRPATNQQNIANAGMFRSNNSGYRGVGWFKPHGLWRARIKINQVDTHLGYFRSPEDAARAYDAAAREAFGEFAFVNFPDD
jgi:hypothetical protein